MPSTVLDALNHGLPGHQAFFESVSAEGRQRKKKKKKKNNGGKQKKIFARCTSQLPACQAFAQETCVDDTACLAALTTCCDQLSSCNFTGFVACFNAGTAS